MQPIEVIDTVKKLAASNSDIAALWLYGSRSKGEAHSHSDYDFAVLFNHRLSDPLERRLRPELLALDWSALLGVKDKMISVIDVQIAPIPLAMNAISGQLLCCNNHSTRLVAEGVIMSKAEIDYHYHLTHF
ncbi:nucleotidyltransferase domain-containing protein [Marinomonas sp. M1K-6]|uniref:Nucleotidyltransferase domain-containing protein n=1 Tax=Marinomonas profundi TaxID=2726122 RepID=A0A847R4Y8_9GAMM|nr:nucleotidyltransferase domain-containing protein [Marinomonas profundi]NLQ19071.1 nucleotidyltransferase domain-containing protein [Marinomonas profundi]UDV04216.1 nucleotidyltransferase domain-containing protein [Marinomonas profundi]